MINKSYISENAVRFFFEGHQYVLISDAQPVNVGYEAYAVRATEKIGKSTMLYAVLWAAPVNWFEPDAVDAVGEMVSKPDMGNIRFNVFPKVRFLMKRQGATSAEIAGYLGITQRAVNLKLAGKRKWKFSEAELMMDRVVGTSIVDYIHDDKAVATYNKLRSVCYWSRWRAKTVSYSNKLCKALDLENPKSIQESVKNYMKWLGVLA